MFEDEYGNVFSQCINCETVYPVESSDSSFRESCCSAKCEDEYKQFIEDLHFEEKPNQHEKLRNILIKKTIKENYEALERLSKS